MWWIIGPLAFIEENAETGAMKSLSIVIAIAAILVASTFLFIPAARADNPHCFDPSNYATFAPIAITSPGSYCFDPGTYNTQITITASNVALVGHGQVVIQPTSLVVNSHDPDTGTPEYNIILVGGNGISVTGVTISKLIVDGSKLESFAPFTTCGDYDYEGVLFLNGGGAIAGSTVENILLAASAAGCQPGLAIEVQTGSGYSSSVSISNNQVINYDKNGITCNDVNTQCSISNSVVYPYAAYQYIIASNGIQIAYGASASISNSVISGNSYCAANGGPSVCGTVATGILTYESSGVSISNNKLSSNDVGIYLIFDGGAISVSNNQVSGSAYTGIVLYLENGATVSNNKATNNGVDGIEFDSTTNSKLSNNLASGNGGQASATTVPTPGTGFYLDQQSTGNSLNNNQATNNVGYGFTDASAGSQTAGTANRYNNDQCSGNSLGGSLPNGLCHS